MPALSSRRVRCRVTTGTPFLAAPLNDVFSGQNIESVAGNATRFEFGFFDSAGNPVDLTNVESLNLKIQPSQIERGLLADKTITDLNTGLTAQEWSQNSLSHAAFDFTNSEMNIFPGGARRTLWLVVTAITTAGSEVTVAAGSFILHEDNNESEGAPAENPGPALSLEQGDARYIKAENLSSTADAEKVVVRDEFGAADFTGVKVDGLRLNDTINLSNYGMMRFVDDTLSFEYLEEPGTLKYAFQFVGASDGISVAISSQLLTSARIYALPDASGTIALSEQTVPNTRSVATSGLATGGGDFATNRTIHVPAASVADVFDGTAMDRALTPYDFWAGLMRGLQVVDMGWAIAETTNGAVANVQTGTAHQSGRIQCATGSTANATFARTVGLAAVDASTTDRIAFNRQIFVGLNFVRAGTSANTIFRFLVSGNVASGSLSTAGFGFEIRNQRVWMLAHNGTSLTSVDTGVDVGSTVWRLRLESNGAGTIRLFRASTLIGTVTNGPTAEAAGLLSIGGTNGADTNNSIIFYGRHILLKI